MIRDAIAIAIAVAMACTLAVTGWLAVVAALSPVVGAPTAIGLCLIGGIGVLVYLVWSWRRTAPGPPDE